MERGKFESSKRGRWGDRKIGRLSKIILHWDGGRWCRMGTYRNATQAWKCTYQLANTHTRKHLN